MMKNKKGISMVSMVITIMVIIILSTVAISNSTSMIDESVNAVSEAEKLEDNENVKTLLSKGLLDKTARTGIALIDENLVVIGSGEVNYGTGYHLLVGGTEQTIRKIETKVGVQNLKAYKDLTAPYIISYDMGTYERIEEIRFVD